MSHSDLTYGSPTPFTLRQRVTLALVSRVANWVLRAIYVTCKFEIRGQEHIAERINDSGQLLLAIWHESMSLTASQMKDTGLHALTSYSYDGEMAAQILKRLGMHCVRGSDSHGSHEAVSELTRAVNLVKIVGFTIDGPRGPRRKAKPGIAVVSARTQVPVSPGAFTVTPSFRLKSWDRFPFPLPFSKVLCAYGPPIPPPASTSEEDVEKTRLHIERELNELHHAIEKDAGVDPLLDDHSS